MPYGLIVLSNISPYYYKTIEHKILLCLMPVDWQAVTAWPHRTIMLAQQVPTNAESEKYQEIWLLNNWLINLSKTRDCTRHISITAIFILLYCNYYT